MRKKSETRDWIFTLHLWYGILHENSLDQGIQDLELEPGKKIIFIKIKA